MKFNNRFLEILILGFAALAIGCSSGAGGSSSSSSTAGVAATGANGNDITNPQVLTTVQFSSYSMAAFPVEIQNMLVVVNNVNYVPDDPATSSIDAYTYTGPIAVAGTMFVSQQITDASGACTIPVGFYTVQTLSPGQANNGEFQTIQLSASGNIQMTLSNGTITNQGTSYGISATLTIQSFAGATCTSFSSLMGG